MKCPLSFTRVRDAHWRDRIECSSTDRWRQMHSLHDNLVHRVNVGDLLLRSAERFPDKEAICDGERRWCYRDFNAWTNRLAHGMAARGVRTGDSVALMSQNCAEFLATYFACAKLGAVCVPINLLWRQRELAYVLEHSRARMVIVEASLADQLQDALPHLKAQPDLVHIEDAGRLLDNQPASEPAFLVEDRAPLTYLYTSGTTSAPKGVVGSHLAIYLNSLGAAIDSRMSDGDRISVMLPLFHTAQLNALCTPAIAVGASMVVLRGFDVDELHERIERERITVLFALPMMIRALVERQIARPRALDSLRLVVYAMAPMPEPELRRANAVLGLGLQ